MGTKHPIGRPAAVLRLKYVQGSRRVCGSLGVVCGRSARDTSTSPATRAKAALTSALVGAGFGRDHVVA